MEWANEKTKKGYGATKVKVGKGLEAAKEAMGKKYDQAAVPGKASIISRKTYDLLIQQECK